MQPANERMKTMKIAKTCCCTLAVTLCVAAASSAQAGLVAKWDFNNYDPANPASPNVLQATVGSAGKPCYYVGKGTSLVTDGTLGQMYVVSPDYSGSDTTVAAAASGKHQANQHQPNQTLSHIVTSRSFAFASLYWFSIGESSRCLLRFY
jgi:hypothetical protein